VRMARPSGNLQRTGVTGHTLSRTVSDLLRSRKPFLYRNDTSSITHLRDLASPAT